MAVIWLGQTIHVNVKMEDLQEKYDAIVQILDEIVYSNIKENELSCKRL